MASTGVAVGGRRLGLRWWGLSAAAVAAVVAVAVASSPTVALRSEGGGGEHALLADLTEIEAKVAAVPIMPSVTLAPDRTWATVGGDLVGAEVLLGDADAALRQLVADAGEVAGPVGDAVESVAAGYRRIGKGYARLAAYERAGLAADASGDTARTVIEQGLGLVLGGLDGLHEGYGVLRELDGEHRAAFQARFDAVAQAAAGAGTQARTALSQPTTRLLVGVERFAGDDPARTVRYACVASDDYVAARAAQTTPSAPSQRAEAVADAPAGLPFDDCPALTR